MKEMAAQLVLVSEEITGNKNKKTVINRASRYLVSQILLLPGRTSVLPSYCNLYKESRNSQPRNLLLSAKAAQLFGPQPNDRDLSTTIILKLSLISCLPHS